MIVHGVWSGKQRPRPIIQASLLCRVKRKDYSAFIEFMVDTGADRTCIHDHHRKMLGISRHVLHRETEPVETLFGARIFRFLPNCQVQFLDSSGAPLVVKLDSVYFADPTAKQSKIRGLLRWKRQPTISLKAKPYSVLGRDALCRLSLGYCNPRDVLFVSTKNEEYRAALEGNFAQSFTPPKF